MMLLSLIFQVQAQENAIITTWDIGAELPLSIPLDNSFAYSFNYTWMLESDTVET